jgi:hypothetical protein
MWTRLADLARGIKGAPAAPVENEAEHFMPCPVCHQMLDMRDLAQVFRHDDPGHGPEPRQ